MSQIIAFNDQRLQWTGAVSVQYTSEWAMPWRIEYAERTLFADPLVERAAMPAGVRIRFRSDTSRLAGTIVPTPELAPIDLYCDGVFMGTIQLDNQSHFVFDNLPTTDKLCELWLPQVGEFKLHTLEVESDATVASAIDQRPHWVTYGSSITQCRTAASPSQTWPAIVARAHDLNLTCLGFGGECHLDSMIARQMRDLPADFISICVGINIYGGATLHPRTFGPSLTGFVKIIREKHPDTPFVVLSPIYSPPREETANAVGFTLKMMREEVEEVVDILQSHGDRNLYYVNGLEIFGPALSHLLPDELHPDAEGYKHMGDSFLRKVAIPHFQIA